MPLMISIMLTTCPYKRLRIHVAVADGRQRLHAEEETVIKPPATGGASDTVRVDSVKGGKQQVERDVKGARPTRQTAASAKRAAIDTRRATACRQC